MSLERFRSRDVPPAAHAKAITALDEFDALLVEYAMLLEAERALLRAGNLDAVGETVFRGDAVARSAATRARRVAALCDEVERGALVGPRAVDLQHRWNASHARAQAVDAGSAAVAALCLAERGAAEREMERHPAPRAPKGGLAAYQGAVRALAIDRQG